MKGTDVQVCRWMAFVSRDRVSSGLVRPYARQIQVSFRNRSYDANFIGGRGETFLLTALPLLFRHFDHTLPIGWGNPSVSQNRGQQKIFRAIFGGHAVQQFVGPVPLTIHQPL